MAKIHPNCELLSAEQLIKLGWTRDSSVPVKGIKEYAPDGSWIESKRFDVTLEERKELLSDERVGKLGALARCEWKPELGKCEVIKHTRKFWQTFGHTEKGVNYLNPEEALFLVDTGMLEIYHGGVPLTLQQAYSSLLCHHISIEVYQVFSFLARYGFILRRHDPDRIVTEYERQLRIDQYSKLPGKKRKLNRNVVEGNCPKRDKPGCSVIPGHKQGPIQRTEEKSTAHSVTKNMTDILNIDLDEPVLDTENHPKRRYTKWNWNEINIPCIADKSSITLSRPNDDLLPCCVQYDRDCYTIKTADLKRKRKWDGEYELSLGGTSWKHHVQAENWGEHRVRYRRYLEGYSLESSPAGHLWRGRVQPLVKPQDAKSAADIMKKLQVIENVQTTHHNFSLNAVPDEGPKLQITYDVHLPNSKFKKSALTAPNHHICVLNSSDRFPSLAEMTVLRENCQPMTPLHFAVVDNGDISFYVFHDICLPVDDSWQ